MTFQSQVQHSTTDLSLSPIHTFLTYPVATWWQHQVLWFSSSFCQLWLGWEVHTSASYPVMNIIYLSINNSDFSQSRSVSMYLWRYFKIRRTWRNKTKTIQLKPNALSLSLSESWGWNNAGALSTSQTCWRFFYLYCFNSFVKCPNNHILQPTSQNLKD